MDIVAFEVNNGRMLMITQDEGDEDCKVGIYKDGAIDKETEYTIPAGDMVMLLNYYRYVKDNSIQCDFVNPTPNS